VSSNCTDTGWSQMHCRLLCPDTALC